MPHHSIAIPPPPEWKSPDTHKLYKTHSYALKIVTPMFGGGYRAGEVDTLNPIHAAGVRGNLRSWWRATSGAQYPTPQKLFAAEEELWGSMKRPGKVATRVHIVPEALKDLQQCLKRCAEYNPRNNDPTKLKSVPDPLNGYPLYALQAFTGELSRDSRHVVTEPARGLVDFPFELLVTCPDEANVAVELAIAAWVRFGGVGARTRRGCGSLVTEAELTPVVFDQIIDAGESNERLTILSGAQAYVGKPGKTAVDAWREAVEIYRDFRQKEDFARNPGTSGRPGRSRWPEPDSIKNRLGSHRNWHHAIASNPVFGFPRADLGLPIIFHFKDAGDPEETTLQGRSEGKRRFASPVITKAVPDGSGKFQSMILILNAPHVWEFGDLALTSTLRVTRAEIDMTKPGYPMNGQKIREALGSYARTRGMK